MAELVGRETQLALLRGYASEALASRGRLVLIGGEPGIGKTTLAEVVADEAAGRGARAVWGVCVDGAGLPDFWPWPDVLAAVGGDLAGLLAHGSGVQAWFAVASSVVAGLRAAAQAAPLVVVLDDLHWADAGALRVLDFAARALRRDPVLLLGTYRDIEVQDGHPLAGLLAMADVVSLEGLATAEVDALLRSVVGEHGVPVAEVVHGRTGGNPFFVLQVGRLLAAGANAQAVPVAVGDAIRRRFARLPQPTAELLRVAAVVGAEVDAAVVADAAHVDLASIVDILQPAVAARVLRALDVGIYRFEHDLFRETAYADLDPGTRAQTHLAVARALGARRKAGGQVRPGDIAHHWARAVPAADPAEALANVEQAARDATTRLAHEEAVRHWKQALRLAELAGNVPPGMQVELGEAMLRVGETDAAREVLTEAARRSGGDALTLACAALALHRVGVRSGSSHAELIELLGRALSALDATSPGEALATRVRAALARELADGPDADLGRAEVLATEAVAAAQACGDAAVLAFCLSAQYDVVWGPGTAARRLEIAGRMANAAIRGGDRDLQFHAILGRHIALLELADPLASSALLEMEELAEQSRQPRLTYLAASRRAAFTILTGDSAKAASQISAAHELAAAIGEPDGDGVWVTQLVALALGQGGAVAAGKAMQALPGPAMPPEYAVQESAMRHLAQGDAAAAAAALGTPRPVPPVSGFRWRALAGAAIEVEADVAAGMPSLLPATYDYLREYAGCMVLIGGAVCAPGPVDLYLGLAAEAMGDLEAAAGHLRAAMALADRLGARPIATRARIELANVLARQGDPVSARQMLTTAADVAAELGLEGLYDRVLRLRATTEAPAAEFRKQSEIWILTFAGTTKQLADAKGLHDIAALLAAPGQQISALQLYGSPDPDTGADEILDAQARAAYKQRLADLEEEIDAAEATHDDGRAAKYRAERDALVAGLAAAYGLGGRVRRLADPGERARSAVTARIRDTLKRIERAHPALGEHLRESISTGRSCAYEPSAAVRWVL
ncbi:ATP-binding protein [Rhizocola hellebori]|nr:AAA family ATPase [Rhizocola hellebori]